MAGQILGYGVRACASCDYYDGQRTLKMSGEVIVGAESGKCFLSRHAGVPRSAMFVCPYWKRWTGAYSRQQH